MEPAILFALSMIETCQEDETCKSAVNELEKHKNLPDMKSTAEKLKKLPEVMKNIKENLEAANSFIKEHEAGTKHSKDTLDRRWVTTVLQLASIVKEAMHVYLYHVRRMQDPVHAKKLGCIYEYLVQIKDRMKELIEWKELSVLFAAQSGRVDSLKKMLKEPDRRVLFIVGSGGIGTTALVNRVYEQVKGEFQHHAYARLSKKPGTRSALADILCQIRDNKNTVDEKGQQDIINEIKQLLKNKRYIIVIDNIWEEQTWKAIRTALQDNEKVEGRSKSIIVGVTRMDDIAKACSSDEDIYRINPLTDEEETLLAVKELYTTGSYSGKCVCSVKEPGLQQVPDKIRENFTRCFRYLSTLPENSKIDRESMIRKWIAEGLLHDEGTDESLEKAACKIFKSLIDINVIEPVHYGYWYPEEDVYYEIHPMTLDALRKMSSIISKPGDCSDKQSVCLLPVRFMTLPVLQPEEFLYDQLTVLDLEGKQDLKIEEVRTICRSMKQLRYLGLSNTDITVLPSEIKNLQHLETLDIRETELKELPQQVSCLSKLTLLLVGAKGNPRYRNDCSNLFDNLPTSLKKVKKAQCVSIPPLVTQLSGLTFLDIMVAELKTQDFKNLGSISALQTLVLQELFGFSKEKINIKKDYGFKSLETFMLDSREPWVVFEKEAMANVENLGFKLYAGTSGRTPSGIKNLKSLQKVTLQYSSRYEGSDCVGKTIETIKEDAGELKKGITLSINGAVMKIDSPLLLAYMRKTQVVIFLILLLLYVIIVDPLLSLRSRVMTVIQKRDRLQLFVIFCLFIEIFLLYRFFGIFCLFILISCLLFVCTFIFELIWPWLSKKAHPFRKSITHYLSNLFNFFSGCLRSVSNLFN